VGNIKDEATSGPLHRRAKEAMAAWGKGHMLPPENVITAMREKEHKQHVQRISYLLMQTAKRGKR
jgi:hypothetical protein